MESSTNNLDKLKKALEDASGYPRNLFEEDLPSETLTVLEDQLEEQAERLFCKDLDAAVGFLELYKTDQGGFPYITIKIAHSLTDRCGHTGYSTTVLRSIENGLE